MTSKFRTTYAIDSLDPNPVVKYFDFYNEVEDYLSEESARRVQHAVDHSPYAVSESDLLALEETEATLYSFIELVTVDCRLTGFKGDFDAIAYPYHDNKTYVIESVDQSISIRVTNELARYKLETEQDFYYS
jgi:hypothetical protein